jgi:hypothetical protein
LFRHAGAIIEDGHKWLNRGNVANNVDGLRIGGYTVIDEIRNRRFK